MILTQHDRIRLASYLTRVCRLRGAWRHTADLVSFARGRSIALNLLSSDQHPVPPALDAFDEAITNEFDVTISGIGHPRMPARMIP